MIVNFVMTMTEHEKIGRQVRLTNRVAAAI